MSKEMKGIFIGGIFTVIAAICAAIVTSLFNGNNAASPSSPAMAGVVIYNQLGPDQINETVEITINGKKVGSIIIDQNKPQDFITITLPVGRHSYDLSAASIFTDQNTYYSSGHGMIEVAEGKEFALQRTVDGLLTLVELP